MNEYADTSDVAFPGHLGSIECGPRPLIGAPRVGGHPVAPMVADVFKQNVQRCSNVNARPHELHRVAYFDGIGDGSR